MFAFIAVTDTHQLITANDAFTMPHRSIFISLFIAVSNNLSLFFQYVGAFVLFISGILFVAGFMSLPALNVGRLLAGCCNGMVYISVLKQIGDNIPSSYRGTITTKLSLLAAF